MCRSSIPEMEPRNTPEPTGKHKSNTKPGDSEPRHTNGEQEPTSVINKLMSSCLNYTSSPVICMLQCHGVNYTFRDNWAHVG